MMKKKLTGFLFIYGLFVSQSFCQLENLDSHTERYRYYRERFNQYFIFIGPNPGESLPFTSRDVNWDDYVNNTLIVNDLPNAIGLYLGVLATEYYLTQKAGGDVNNIIRELHFALFALNRLDMAESGIGNTALDGFIVREDVPADFLSNTANGHSAHFNRGLMYPGDGELLPVTRHNGNSLDPFTSHTVDQCHIPECIAASMDHRIRLLMGLALIKKFVDANASFGTFQDGETSIRQEAINITHRIMMYMKLGGWFIWLPTSSVTATVTASLVQLQGINIPTVTININNLEYCFQPMHILNPADEPCTNCPLITPYLSELIPRGCAPIPMSYGFAAAGNFITGINYFDPITDAAYSVWACATGMFPGCDIATSLIYNKPSTLSLTFALAATGNSWIVVPPFFSTKFHMNNLDNINYDWRFHTLLLCALHDINPPFDYDDIRLQTLLDDAPCIGPNAHDPYTYWYNDNLFDNSIEFKIDTIWGYTRNGLDYMLLFNLYNIVYENQHSFPPYTTSWLKFQNASTIITNTNITYTPGYADFPDNINCNSCPFTDIGSKTHPVEIRALNTIFANNTINANANVWYHAGRDLDFGDGFDVQAGAEWDASIDPVFCDGNDYKSSNTNDKPAITLSITTGSGTSNNSIPENVNIDYLTIIYDSQKVAVKNEEVNSTTNASIKNNSYRQNSPHVSSGNTPAPYFVIIPNPASGLFAILSNKPCDFEATVTDVLGRTVFQRSVKNNIRLNIDLNAGKGVYFVKVVTGEDVFVQKIILQ